MKPPEDLDLVNLLRLETSNGMNTEAFSRVNAACLLTTTLSRSARALEIIVQACWMDCFEARVKAIAAERPDMSATECKMASINEACNALGWTEKELRNRMMIWRGYQEIKNAAGWVALVFSGSGIYSQCKYRVGFDSGLLQRISKLQVPFEVAADTLHPQWRLFLLAFGIDSPREYTGHPHDWVIRANKPALPLNLTYHQWDQDFSFEHLENSVLDECWNGQDPRQTLFDEIYMCLECGQRQSNDIHANKCNCYPSLFANRSHITAPVQVGSCPQGKNNGLFARCGFDRGVAVGEFVGLITKGVQGVDVMMGGQGEKAYQIYQGRMGNYTRFINHSCAPNAQFERFTWCGGERILIVSKGIDPGMEITVDYSSSYWKDLDKRCLCGETCCRYNDSERREKISTLSCHNAC